MQVSPLNPIKEDWVEETEEDEEEEEEETGTFILGGETYSYDVNHYSNLWNFPAGYQ